MEAAVGGQDPRTAGAFTVPGLKIGAAIMPGPSADQAHSVRLVTQSSGDRHEDQRLFPFLVLRRPSAFHLLGCYRIGTLRIVNAEGLPMLAGISCVAPDQHPRDNQGKLLPWLIVCLP